MAEKLNPFYKLLKTEVPLNITSELKETFDSVNKALSDACELALKQPIPGKQLVLMTDASFRSAGSALMIEDNPDQKIQSKRKTYAPVALGLKIFSPAQLKMSIYSKEILAILMAFLEFAHILWEATKPTIVLTDNKSVTRFFQTKAIPPALSGMHVITYLTRNLWAVFQCMRNAGLKLTIEKCLFGVKQVENLGRTISSEVVSPQTLKS